MTGRSVIPCVGIVLDIAGERVVIAVIVAVVQMYLPTALILLLLFFAHAGVEDVFGGLNLTAGNKGHTVGCAVETGYAILSIVTNGTFKRFPGSQCLLIFRTQLDAERGVLLEFRNRKRALQLETDFIVFILDGLDSIQPIHLYLLVQFGFERIEFLRLFTQFHLLENTVLLHLFDIEPCCRQFCLGHTAFIEDDLFEVLRIGAVFFRGLQQNFVFGVLMQFTKVCSYSTYLVERNDIQFGHFGRILHLGPHVFEEIGDEQAVALLIKGRLILRRRVGRNNFLISLVVLYQVADRFDTAVFGVTQQNGLLVRVGMDRHRTFRGCRIRFFLFCHNSKILMVGMSLQCECMTLI